MSNDPHEFMVISPDGAWETYAIQSARLALAERRRNARIAIQIVVLEAVLTVGSFTSTRSV